MGEKSDSMAPSGLSMERLGRARLDARCSQRARVIANAVSQRSGWVTKKLNQHRSGGLGNNTLRTKAFEEEGKDDDVDFQEGLRLHGRDRVFREQAVCRRLGGEHCPRGDAPVASSHLCCPWALRLGQL